MSHLMKKSLTWIVVTMMVLMLTIGCSNSGSKSEPSTKDPVKSESSSNVEGLSGNFEIQYFVGGYGDEWWKTVIAEFGEKNPKLKITQSAGSQINEQMKPRWIQGNPPDVVFIDGAGSNETQMVLDDQLLDITEWFGKAKNVNGKSVSELLIAQPYDYEGKHFSLPLVFGSWGTFYDKAMFAEKGWEVPTDYESFIKTAEQIKASGISPYIHTGIYPYYILGGLVNSAIVAENGGDGSILVDMANNKEGVFKSDPVMRALDKIVEMREKGLIDLSSTALNHTDSQIQFLQHKAAFIPNGLWLPNEMAKDVPDGFDIGFIPSVMHDKGGKYVAIPYTNTIAVAKKAKNPEAAKAFLEFIFTEKAAVQWAEITGALMNVKTDLESTQASDVSKTAMSYFNGDETIVAPVAVLNEDVHTEMQNAIIALLTGDITPQKWSERMEAVAAASRK